MFFAVLNLTLIAYSQQRPQYTQYISNYFLINPAAAGIEKDINIAVSYRKQWAGLEGAPSISYLTFNKALNNEYVARGDSSEMKFNPIENALPLPHHGIGLTVINEELGALNRFVCYASYAYHVKLSPKMNLSAGISGGVSSLKVHHDKLALEIPADPAVYNYTGKAKADINAGLCIYGKKFFAGISAQQIVPQDVLVNGYYLNTFDDRTTPDLFLSGEYRFNISDDIKFYPSALLKYINTVPLTFDLNGKIDYQNLVWLGYSYRYKSGMAVFGGIKIKEAIRVGYSYDITTSDLKTVSNGTHELLLAFTIKKK